MIPDAIDAALALVETIAPLGSHRISFDRDATDSFALTLERLTPGDDRPDLRKDELHPLLPQGSRWNPAVGWRSFIALPFDRPGVCAAAVGVEGVIPHASRGAFPIMRAFLMPAENVPAALSRLAAAWPGTSPIADLLDHRCYIKISEARTPAEHEQHEAPMLRAAAEAWRFGEPKLLRTLMLSDDQAPWPKRWTEKLRELTPDAQPPSYLIATAPPIRAHFSASTKFTLWRKELLG